MAPMTQVVCIACKTAADNIAYLCHWCIGSTISVEKVVGRTWEEQWCDKRVSRGLPLATQICAL
eukprot:11447048-Ditylum_brightwellii.AAC.1